MTTKLPNPTAEARATSETERRERVTYHAAEIARAREAAGCALCADAQAVRLTADPRSPLFGIVVPCSCVPLADRAALAGIPERYRTAQLETMERLPRKAKAIGWGERWDGRGSAIIASAPPSEQDKVYGTGKTHLACALLVREIERGRPARFVDVTDYLDEIKARFDAEQGEQAEAYTARLAAEPLLALDDVSAHRLTTDWQRGQVATLIDRRYRAQLVTLITTNFTGPDEIEEALGGALASRLRDYAWIPMGGEDLRGRGEG